MPHSVSQKKPEIPAWSRVGTNVDLNNSHAFNAPWALELYQHGELDRWVDGPSIFERVIRWAISLNGSSSRVVWPIRSWPIPKNIRNTSKHGAFTEQGFSFDYLASRNKVEHGCTEDCDGQMITLWSRGYAPNLSTCVFPLTGSSFCLEVNTRICQMMTLSRALSQRLLSQFIYTKPLLIPRQHSNFQHIIIWAMVPRGVSKHLVGPIVDA